MLLALLQNINKIDVNNKIKYIMLKNSILLINKINKKQIQFFSLMIVTDK